MKDVISSDIEIELVWETPGVDSDLQVATADAACGYNSRDALPEVTFSGDDRGTGSMPAMEFMRISPETSDRFHVVVVAYSGKSEVRGATGRVVLSWRRADDGEDSHTVGLADADGKAWHLATFERGREGPLLVGRETVGFTNSNGWLPEA